MLKSMKKNITPTVLTYDLLIEARSRAKNINPRNDTVWYINPVEYAILEVLQEDLKRQAFLGTLFNIIIGLSSILTLGLIYVLM